MNEGMNLLQAGLLSKPRKPCLLLKLARALAEKLKTLQRADSIVIRGALLALVAVALLAMAGTLHAEPSEAEKFAAHKRCRAELGPLGVPVWTADGQIICQRLTLSTR